MINVEMIYLPIKLQRDGLFPDCDVAGREEYCDGGGIKEGTTPLEPEKVCWLGRMLR